MKPTTLALAAAAIAFALPAMTSSASAYACKSAKTTAAVQHPVRSVARRSIGNAWSQKVRNNYGLAWSVIKYARTKSGTCAKNGSNWVCVFSARPCKYVPRS